MQLLKARWSRASESMANASNESGCGCFSNSSFFVILDTITTRAMEAKHSGPEGSDLSHFKTSKTASFSQSPQPLRLLRDQTLLKTGGPTGICLAILSDQYLKQVSSQKKRKQVSGYEKVLSLSHISKKQVSQNIRQVLYIIPQIKSN